jgi:hypothetical protein
MSPDWHYCSEGKDYGPVTFTELKQLVAEGKLLPTDMLWNERIAEWQSAGELPHLFPEEETATVVLIPDHPAEQDPLASLQFEVARPNKSDRKASGSSRPSKANTSRPSKVSVAGRRKPKHRSPGRRVLIFGGLVACVNLAGFFWWNGSSVVRGVTQLGGSLAGSGKAISLEQYQSVPRGALRFRVEDVFGSPLASTHDFEDVEQYGSNGEIFGSQFVNTFMLAYRLSDKPGKVAVFVFQGSSTNPPMVEKHIE